MTPKFRCNDGGGGGDSASPKFRRESGGDSVAPKFRRESGGDRINWRAWGEKCPDASGDHGEEAEAKEGSSGKREEGGGEVTAPLRT